MGIYNYRFTHQIGFNHFQLTQLGMKTNNEICLMGSIPKSQFTLSK